MELDAAMTELVRDPAAVPILTTSADPGKDRWPLLEQLPVVDHAGVALFGESGVIRSLAHGW